MIFSEHHCALILAGRKTRTWRPGLHHIYRVGRVYAIQPGRGKKAIGHVHVLRAQSQCPAAMTFADAQAEGYETWGEFLDALDAVNGRCIGDWEEGVAYEFELVKEAES